MPGMSGLELLHTVREEYPHLAFVMVTGADDIGVCVQVMKEGADDYLVKPLNLKAVRLNVKRALERKKLEVEVEKHRLRLEETVEKQAGQLRSAMRRVERTYDETLQALAANLNLGNNATSGHPQRVMKYATEIAKEMRCTNEELKTVARGAQLHDIGKIAIPDAILTKTGPLTPAERALMETHVRHGYDMLSGIAFLEGAAEIVLTHREWFDGTGYPQGLKGDDIPLGARIVAVAEAFDVMVWNQPYSSARTFEDAVAEIRRCSGTQLDPKVVTAFLDWLEIYGDPRELP
jgi:response regulator RpfG family c-di-GMP phosphodiesterase